MDDRDLLVCIWGACMWCARRIVHQLLYQHCLELIRFHVSIGMYVHKYICLYCTYCYGKAENANVEPQMFVMLLGRFAPHTIDRGLGDPVVH